MTREQTFIELRQAREIFTKRMEYQQYRDLVRGLLVILGQCPEELMPMVEGHILEADMRYALMLTHGRNG